MSKLLAVKDLRPILQAMYRAVPELDRILKAVEDKEATGCTYAAASMKEFGNRCWADKIRYWHNKCSMVNREPYHEARTQRPSPRAFGRCLPALRSLRPGFIRWRNRSGSLSG